MRVSDGYMYDLANRRLMRSRAESTVVGAQVSSGKRVEAPWDDAAAAGLITRFAQDKVRQGAMQSAADRASEELGAVDSAFQQVVTTLSRAQELAVQLSNDTYNAGDRASAGVEVQQLFQSVVSQLNIRLGDRYLFGGTADQAPPFDATGAYLGDTNTRRVEIAPGVLQDASIRADSTFRGVGGGIDVLTSLSNLSTALGTNDATGIRAAIQELADGMKQVTASQSRAGAMMNVFDVASSTARINGDTATDARAQLEDIDIFDASTRFAAAERALEASMSAAAKSFKLTLLDVL
ncbi:MAG: flagellin [Myxococcales bacterium]|nr:flagellin [Myxococcales bacterium]MDP3502922.1 flagellin [Myxococcales bacterium]